MAEVLITLGIIGIVAAMTMPVLLANKQKKELQTGLKAAYSILQQALNRASYEEGYTISQDNIQARSLKKLIMPYFDSPVDCSWGGIHGTTNTIICAGGISDTTAGQSTTTYNNYAKNTGNISTIFLDDGQFITKNGMLFMIENQSAEYRTYISVDVNGVSKKPNVWGQDLFTFQLTKEGKILPMGAEGTDYYQKESQYCSKTSTSNYNGVACTQKAMTDENYWKTLP